MPMIVKTPDNQPMLFYELTLLAQDRIIFAGGQVSSFVKMVKKSRLMRDDQVVSSRGSALKHVERGHHCHRNSRNRRVGIPGFEAVNSIGRPRTWQTMLQTRDDLARGQRCFLAGGRTAHE